MEQFIKKADQLNIGSIRTLASQKALRSTLKPNDNFYIPNPDLGEIEPLLKSEGVGYKKMAHPTYTITLFTIID